MAAALSIAAFLGLASTVAAHGQVSGIVANGLFYEGYSPSMQYSNPAPVVIGWSIPEDLSNGFVASSDLTSPDVICHVNATPAQGHANVAAGDVVELQWTPWPSSHHGPVIDYLANCNGPCESVDKTKLEFFKIDGVGLTNDNPVPGTWATDELIANNNSWVVTIPKDIAPGNYVLRHEIIALHSAEEAGGAQLYPHCVNLAITGSGTDKPTGTLGTALYKEADPGIEVNIYASLASYVIPGPSPIASAVSMKQAAVSITGNGVVATGSAGAATAVASSSAAATSAAAPSSPASSSSAAPATSAAASSSSAVTSAPAAPATTTLATSAQAISSAASSALGLTSALPSSILTSVLPTAVPTGTTTTGSAPKPIPSGTSVQDLLEWMNYVFNLLFKDLESEQKNHARSFSH
ncbi:MAG: hypothetical protein M1822_009961 [Bathelium mastoideum]|nr:MAG: hypothetical protein M1822_009961 [Bathelium mastoideum]